jgi:hypothetical protein
MLELKPTEIPQIAWVVYPWRNLTIPPEKQVPDDLNILIMISGIIREEWYPLFENPKVYNIDGIGNPQSVTISPELSAITLNLKEPLKKDTTIHIGPIDLGEDIKFDEIKDIDSPYDNPPQNKLLGPCFCDMWPEDGSHDYEETEDFYWATMLHTSESSCPIPGPTYMHNLATDVEHTPVTNYTATLDNPQFSQLTYSAGWMPYPPVSNIWNLYSFDGWRAHDCLMTWDENFFDLFCGSSNHSVTLAHTFTAVDLTPPTFVEPPALGHGPQVAEYLMQYYQDSLVPESRIHYLMYPPTTYASDFCSTYLVVHATDDRGLNQCPTFSVQLDILQNENWYTQYSGVPLGGCIWIDNDTVFNQEIAAVGSTPMIISNDGRWDCEELIIPIDITPLVNDPLVTDIRARITDHRNCWRRSDNVLEPNQNKSGKQSEKSGGYDPMPSYTVVDLIYRDTNRYDTHGDICYDMPHNIPPYRREECDGFVMPRLNGECDLDICALVSTKSQLSSVACEISAPYDESNKTSHDPLSINLYHLSRSADPQLWDNIYIDIACGYQSPDIPPIPPEKDDCYKIYCRGDGRSFVDYPFGIATPPFVKASDSHDDFVPTPETGNPPYLYVSSNDAFYAPNTDYKDYSIAVARQVGFEKYSWIKQWIWACHYGNGNHGTYNTDTCSKELPEEQDNYKYNVLTYGQEVIKAIAQDQQAFYPVESEADIFFVFAHDIGSYSGAVLAPFKKDDWDPDPYPPSNVHSWTDVMIQNWGIVPQEWQGNYNLTNDAEWLVAFACHEINQPIDGTQRKNQDWRSIIRTAPNLPGLKSVLGFNEDLWYDYINIEDPSADLEHGAWYMQFFIAEFCDNLESDNFVSDSSKWLVPGDRPMNDKGILCWMETALEYYTEFKNLKTEHPEWTEIQPKVIRPVAAIDASYEYQLTAVAVEEYKIQRIDY